MQTFPARGKNAVEILLNDHTTIKRLLAELADARESGQRRATLERLKALLTVHNATEENLVYPAIALVANDKRESKHLYEETADADVLLFQLDSMLKSTEDESFPEKAREFQAAVLEHIDDEETSAFPHLQESAKPEQEERLTEAVREFRESFAFTGPSDQS